SEQLPPLTRYLADVLDQSCASGEGSWGMGFYQNGDVLLKKQPLLRPQSFQALIRTDRIHSSVLVVHHKTLAGEPYKYEQSHPFRYRGYVFAHEGVIPGFTAIQPEILDYIPGFIRSNIRGRTDSEHLFHLLLAFLRDAGQLENRLVPQEAVIDALRSTFALVRSLCTQHGATDDPTTNLVLTNGEFLVAVRRGFVMHYRRVDSFRLPKDGRDESRELPFIEYRNSHAVVIGSRLQGLDDSWTELEDGGILFVDGQGECSVGRL
ncbi:MAG: class II glutamine amidotransferase, partial [Myxococcales bacterium]|nr:class II glutamine amidotransferase [Myxococcales bacterium]